MLQMHLMPKCILAYIFQRKMFSVHFPKENVQLCKNAFDAKMLCFLLCKKQRCCAKMHFCITFCFAEHFPLENVRKNAFLHQMHLMRTFCFAEHFPLENVQLCKNAFDAKMLCFLLCKKQRCCAKMHFCITFCFAEHFPLENVRKNAFLHQMHFCINKMLQMHFGNAYILLCKMFSITFSKGKCSASNAFWRTFDFVKCSASHFPKENVQQSNAQHQIHFCKCCAWAAKTSKAKNNLVSQTILFFVNKALR